MPGTTWTDSSGNSWSCTITVSTVKRVQQLTGINLMEAFEGLLMTLADDPVQLANVLYVVCKPQADERKITDEQFGELLAGDVIESATAAFVQGLIDFFPNQRRQVLKQIWAKTQKARQALTDLATEKVDSPAMDAAIANQLQQASQEIDRKLAELGSSSGNSPESSASTPAP